MGQRKNTGAFPRVWLTPGHSEYREERAKRKKRREQGKKSLIMQWRKEGNKMSLCWMPPWNSHLTLMSQIGVALIRQEKQTHAYTHTHTPVQITQTNWVYFFYVVGRAPKCVIIRKWGKKNTFLVCFWRRTQRTWTKRQVQATLQRNRRCISCHRRFPLWVFFLLAHVYVIMTLFLLTSHVKRMCCTLLHHVARWCSPQEKSRYTQLLTIEKGKKEKKKETLD